MSQSSWEADKMLDVYIYDYLVKRKLHASAKAFMTEAKVATDPVAIDAPGGFLYEWWSVFWDVFISRTNAKHSEPAAAYIEVQQMKAKEQQKMTMQQRNVQLQRGNPNHSPNAASAINIQPNGIMGQPSSSMMAMKMYDGMKTPQSMELETSDTNRMVFPRSTSEHQGQLLHGNSGNMSALQQTPSRTHLAAEARSDAMGAGQRSMAPDPSMYGQGIIQSKSGGPGAAGLNQGASGIPLKGWPLTTPSLSLQKPNMQTQSQFLLASQQQQALAQGNHGSLGNSSQYADVDARRFGGLPRSGLLAKDGQSARNDGAISASGQANSAKMKMGQMQQSSSSQPQDQLLQQQQQLPQQTTRKRRQPSSSGPANNTGTGNTTGPSPASPQSTHTAGPGDGITAANSMHRTAQQNIYQEGGGILVSSSNLLDDLDHFGDLASLDENVDSFLTSDVDGTNLYGTLKQNPTVTRKEGSKGPEFPLGEVGCIRSDNSKITCCHFSSDGKILASAGHDKKVVFWNMNNLETETTTEEHMSVVTDVRFRPNSTHVATTSVDKSVRLWDAANPSLCLRSYTTHSSPIMSLDFHPVKTDMFCFCDNDNEIRYVDVNSFNFTRSHKGGAAQVRFQPRTGKFLAAASDKLVSIFDVETDRQLHTFQGHPDLVNYICWDPLGDYLASVSQNLVKVWSMVNGQCVQEHFSSNMNQFHSCVFHPGYTAVLLIGGVACLDMWNVAENKSMLIPAHEDIVSALSHNPVSNMVASASHDCSVKIWK